MKNTILIIFCCTTFISCSTVHKLFHKEKSKIDSSSVLREQKDSIAENDITHVKSSQIENNAETILSFDRGILIPSNDTNNIDRGIYIYPKNPDDYFEIDPVTGKIRTNAIPSKVVIRGAQKASSFDSLSNHSKIQESYLKTDSTHLKTDKKEVIKGKTVRRFTWWWLLLLIPAYIIYRNWPKIKAFVIHLITGL